MAKHNAHLYPGPGHYETELPIGGNRISFIKDKKDTTIEKSFEPGPGSYAVYGTVGNLRGYLKEEKHPRVAPGVSSHE